MAKYCCGCSGWFSKIVTLIIYHEPIISRYIWSIAQVSSKPHVIFQSWYSFILCLYNAMGIRNGFPWGSIGLPLALRFQICILPLQLGTPTWALFCIVGILSCMKNLNWNGLEYTTSVYWPSQMYPSNYFLKLCTSVSKNELEQNFTLF